MNLTIIVTQMEGGLNNFRKRILGVVEFAHRQCFPICDCDVYITCVGGRKVTMILNFYKISVIRHTVSREKGMTVVGVPVKWCEILLQFLYYYHSCEKAIIQFHIHLYIYFVLCV